MSEISQAHAQKFKGVSHLPQELQIHIPALQTAQALAKLGFYTKDPDEVHARFPLPPELAEDLQICFDTYADLSGQLPIEQLRHALMYAGIFEDPPPFLSGTGEWTRARSGEPTEVSDIGSVPESLSYEQFLSLGHDMLIARFGDKHNRTAKNLFERYDIDDSNSLDMDELSRCFKETIHPNVSAEEIESLAEAWAHDGLFGKITLESFLAIMARFVRKHQPDWETLCAFREIMGKDDLTEGRVDAEMLLQRAKLESVPLTEDEAFEMLWASDIKGKKGENPEEDGVAFKSLMGIVFASLEEISGELPPPPGRNGDKKRVSVSRGGNGEVSERLARGMPEFMVLPPPSRQEGWDATRSLGASTTPAPLANPGAKSTVAWGDGEKATVSRDSKRVEGLDANEVPDEFANVPKTFRARLHLLLEEPTSSRAASYFSTAMLVVIMSSVLVLVAEPLISGKDEKKKDEELSDEEKNVWKGIEIVFTVIFSMELILRASVANALGTHTTCQWLRQPGTLCDIAAVLPYFTDLFLEKAESSFKMLRVIRMLRIGRVMRVSRMAKFATKVGGVDMVQPVAVTMIVIWFIYLKHSEMK
jgi:Ca2+-binding EF-hand superfamily protein